jgi:hypothetical protein
MRSGTQELKKHFVYDLGARPQHEADLEDYKEGSEEDDTFMDLAKSKMMKIG